MKKKVLGKSMRMVAFNKHSDSDNRGLKSQKAKMVYLFTDPASLYDLGKFLINCSVEMKLGGPFHRHFRDFKADWDSNLIDMVVERQEPAPKK